MSMEKGMSKINRCKIPAKMVVETAIGAARSRLSGSNPRKAAPRRVLVA